MRVKWMFRPCWALWGWCLLLGSGCASWVEPRHHLQLILETGDEFQLVWKQRQIIRQTVMGINQSIDQQWGGTYSVSVRSASKDLYRLAFTYQDLHYEQSSMMGKTASSQIDSDEAAPTSPATNIMEVLIGHTFEVDITRKGSIQRVMGVEELYEAFQNQARLQGGPSTQEKAVFKQKFGEEGIRVAVSRMLGFHPKRRVRLGDRWEPSGPSSVLMSVESTSAYELQRSVRDTLTLRYRERITPRPTEEVISLGQANHRYDMTGRREGVYLIDAVSGVLWSLSTTQTLTGSVYLYNEGDTEMTWPILIETWMTVERVHE